MASEWVRAAITGTYSRCASEVVQDRLGLGQPQPIPRPTLSAHSSPSCFSTAPLWGKDAGAGRGKAHRENGASSDPPLRASVPTTWDLSPPLIGLCWLLRRGEARATPYSGCSHSINSPTSYRGDSCQDTVGKDVTHAHVRSISPTKPLCTCRFYRDTPPQKTPFQDQDR